MTEAQPNVAGDIQIGEQQLHREAHAKLPVSVPAVVFGQGHGTEWLRSIGKSVTPQASRVAELVDWLFAGIYHVQDAVVRADWSHDLYVELRVNVDMATFDSDLLTRFVVGCHDYAIRGSIAPCGPHTLRLLFHPRHGREGSFGQRHPTIEHAIERMQRHPYGWNPGT